MGGAIVIETSIERPAVEVFAYMQDHSHQKDWQAENVLELSVEPPGPAQVGTKVHKTRRTPMGKLSFTQEVTDLDEASRRWTELTTSGELTGTKVSWQVLEEGEGALVRLAAEMRAKGPSRALLPLIRRSARKDWQTELASLKKLLETPSTG